MLGVGGDQLVDAGRGGPGPGGAARRWAARGRPPTPGRRRALPRPPATAWPRCSAGPGPTARSPAARPRRPSAPPRPARRWARRRWCGRRRTASHPLVGRRAGQPGRPGVGDRRRVGAEADDHADVEPLGEVGDLAGEGLPLVVRFGADQQQEVVAVEVDAACNSMDGQVRPVSTPSARCIVGRRDRKSSSASASKVATVVVSSAWSSAWRAFWAPRPASIQPSRASTSHRRLEVGLLEQLVEGHSPPVRAARRRPRPARPAW